MPPTPYATQLSLFDAPEPPPPQSPRRERAPPPAAPAPSPQAPQPLAFSHPQAERELQLGEHRVSYALRRGRQRTIRFLIVPANTRYAPRTNISERPCLRH